MSHDKVRRTCFEVETVCLFFATVDVANPRQVHYSRTSPISSQSRTFSYLHGYAKDAFALLNDPKVANDAGEQNLYPQLETRFELFDQMAPLRAQWVFPLSLELDR